jgi:hypothetical protein
LEGYNVRKRVLPHSGKDPIKQAVIKRNLWRAAAIIPLLVLLVAVPLKTDLFKAKIESTNLNPLANAEFEYNKKIVDRTLSIDSTKNIETDNKPVAEISLAPEVVKPPESKGKTYYLITGSFKSEENAVYQVNMLKNEGMVAEIVNSGNGFYRVCAMTFSDLTTALSMKDSISQRFPGTWISRVK